MTIQKLRVLRVLKKAQGKETCAVNIDMDLMLAFRLNEKYVYEEKVSLNRVKEYLQPAIRELIEAKLLERDGPYTVRLTHSGFHYWQTVLSMIVKFLLTSIAVPILVAAATTLVTLWIQGIFTVGQ